MYAVFPALFVSLTRCGAAVDFATMKKELSNLRQELLTQFKKDLDGAKDQIMTALRK